MGFVDNRTGDPSGHCRCEMTQGVATEIHFSSRAIFVDEQQFVSSTTVSGDTDYYYSFVGVDYLLSVSMRSTCHDFHVSIYVWNSIVGGVFSPHLHPECTFWKPRCARSYFHLPKPIIFAGAPGTSDVTLTDLVETVLPSDYSRVNVEKMGR